MASDVVEIILALRNLRQFVSGTEQASKGVAGVGTATEKAGKKAGIGWKGVAKWAGGAAAIYGAQRFVRGAVTATEDLGKSTLALSRTTGLDVKTSSEWATVLKARGVQTTLFQRGLVTLSKQIEKSRTGSAAAAGEVTRLGKAYDAVKESGGKKATAALAKLQTQIDKATAKGAKARSVFAALGVSQEDITKGNAQAVLLQVSDAFSKMTNPVKRAALAQQLFSRSGLALAPILFKGSDAIREQLGVAGKYVHFRAKNAKQVADEIAHQRELKMAYLGLQVSLGTALLPVILKVTGLLVKLADVTSPLTHNSTLLAVAIGTLTAAFVIYKVATIAASIATLAMDAALAPVLIPVVAITAGLIALGVATYFVIKHWDWLKAKAIEVWGWIKAHWPLLVGILVGPFGLAIVLVIRHFGQIKTAAKTAIDFVIRQFQRAVDFIKSIPGKIGSPFKGALGGAGSLLGKARGALPFAQGGTMPRRGPALVGERGPELLSLPGGATITPLAAGDVGAGALAGAIQLTTQLVVDRRVLAEAVATHTADKLARR